MLVPKSESILLPVGVSVYGTNTRTNTIHKKFSSSPRWDRRRFHVLTLSFTPHADTIFKNLKGPLKRRDNFSRFFCEHNIYWISGRFKRANWSDVRLTDLHSFFYYRTLFLFPQNSNQAQHECGDMERGHAQVKGTEKTRSYKMKCVCKASTRSLKSNVVQA